MAMPTLPPSDYYGMSPAAQVLADPVLWRSISSFQHGLPMVLYEFWVTHEPAIAVSNDRHLTGEELKRLMKLVIAHGPPSLLHQVANVCYKEDDDGAAGWTTVSLDRVGLHAIEANRPDLLLYALQHGLAAMHSDLWYYAVDAHQDGDMRVFEVLQAQQQTIAIDELQSITHAVKDVRVAQWLEARYPGSISKGAMEYAAKVGDMAMIQFLMEHYSLSDFGLSPYELAHSGGHFGILQYLLKPSTEVDPRVVKCLLRDADEEVLTILHDLGGFDAHALEAASRSISSGCLNHLKRLFDARLLTKASVFSIDDVAHCKQLTIIKFLMERATTIATTEAMDRAARQHNWDVVEFLHENRSEGCTTAAMDAAAEDGCLEYVKFLHEKRTEGCTTDAMDAAARNGTLDVVQFLHDNRTEGCTTRAMDQAAGRGHLPVVKFLHEHRTEGCTTAAMDQAAGRGLLHVVQFLHEHRTEGCTTQAMDLAAGRGHITVVQYLDTHRTEGCTVAAITNAAKNGYLTVVRFLYKHYHALFNPDVLHCLLLNGAFDIWLELRDQFPEQANAVIESVMVNAGKEMELATIHFVIHELGRSDLAHLAMNGVAKNADHRDTQWPRAVYRITGPGSCRLSAIESAMESIESYSKPDKLQFLISVCSEPGAYELAFSFLARFPEHSSVVQEMEWWQPCVLPPLPALTPLLLDVRSPGWAITREVGDWGSLKDPYEGWCAPFHWAIQAIYRGDHRFLQQVHELRSSSEAVKCELGKFSFYGARAAAVRKGDLHMLKWLLENVSEIPVEPTLLSEALFYHRFEITEYLAEAFCPDACREISWTNKTHTTWLGPCGPGTELSDWIQSGDSKAVNKALAEMARVAVSTQDFTAFKELRELSSEIGELIDTLWAEYLDE